MTGFYTEDDKLTYDRAGTLVRRFIRQHCSHRETVTVLEVCSTMDVELSKHNEIRVREALRYYCPDECVGGRRKRYNLPEEPPR